VLAMSKRFKIITRCTHDCDEWASLNDENGEVTFDSNLEAQHFIDQMQFTEEVKIATVEN
jgi:hypothetical protein